MTTETLNIDYHNKRLMLKALNKHPTVEQAAKALGISERTLYRWMEEYKIVRVPMYVVDGNYKIVNTF
jgi:transcriptional regulator with PAS, ATPase and Fis domain